MTPIARKVKYGAAASMLAMVITTILAVSFHTHLSPALVALLPVLLTSVIGWAVAYLTKHDPKILAALEFYAANSVRGQLDDK
jgi:xanthine/uracil permease